MPNPFVNLANNSNKIWFSSVIRIFFSTLVVFVCGILHWNEYVCYFDCFDWVWNFYFIFFLKMMTIGSCPFFLQIIYLNVCISECMIDYHHYPYYSFLHVLWVDSFKKIRKRYNNPNHFLWFSSCFFLVLLYVFTVAQKHIGKQTLNDNHPLCNHSSSLSLSSSLFT